MRTCVTSKIQTLSQIKLRFTAMNLQAIDVDFLHQIWLQTSAYMTQRITATPTLIGMWCYEFHYYLNFTWTTHINVASFMNGLGMKLEYMPFLWAECSIEDQVSHNTEECKCSFSSIHDYLVQVLYVIMQIYCVMYYCSSHGSKATHN